MKKLPFISLSTIGSLASIVGIWFAVADRGEDVPARPTEPIRIQLEDARSVSNPSPPVPSTPSSLTGEFPVPRIYDLPYDEARALLIETGWIPARNHHLHGQSVEVQSGNGPIFWDRGYWELEACSGTGAAPCVFRFFDPSRRVLVVTTEGEEDENGRYHARVARYSLETESED